MITKELEDFEEQPVQVFPYPERYGGTLANEANVKSHNDDGDMLAFSINVTQEEAAKKLQEKEE